jgi:drug/metabolite transporter (DMT)-like permease
VSISQDQSFLFGETNITSSKAKAGKAAFPNQDDRMEAAQESTPLLVEKRSNQDNNNNNGVIHNVPVGDLCQPHTASSTSSATSSYQLLQSRLLLLGVAFMYGSLNVTLRMVYKRPGPPTASVLSTTRGWMAVFCFLPFLTRWNQGTHDNDSTGDSTTIICLFPESETTSIPPGSNLLLLSTLRDNHNRRRLIFCRFALELAVFNFGSQGLLNLGLITTESARASFLVQLSVVITPTISALLGQKVRGKVWCACLVALVGLYLLSSSQGNFLSVQFTTGDICCLGSAMCWSYYIYRMSAWGEYFDETMTQFCKNIFLASMYAAWMITAMLVNSDESLWEGWKDPISWLLLFYSALGPCTIADIVQQKAQSSVPAAESNVILSLEPVFTAILGIMLLGELLSWNEVTGGSLIVVASVLAGY